MLTKGIFQETMSKVVLAVTGFVLNLILARELGPAGYGVVGIILGIMFIFELFLTNGLRQAVSKILSSQRVNTRKALLAILYHPNGVQPGACAAGVVDPGQGCRVVENRAICEPALSHSGYHPD